MPYAADQIQEFLARPLGVFYWMQAIAKRDGTFDESWLPEQVHAFLMQGQTTYESLRTAFRGNNYEERLATKLINLLWHPKAQEQVQLKRPRERSLHPMGEMNFSTVLHTDREVALLLAVLEKLHADAHTPNPTDPRRKSGRQLPDLGIPDARDFHTLLVGYRTRLQEPGEGLPLHALLVAHLKAHGLSDTVINAVTKFTPVYPGVETQLLENAVMAFNLQNGITESNRQRLIWRWVGFGEQRRFRR